MQHTKSLNNSLLGTFYTVEWEGPGRFATWKVQYNIPLDTRKFYYQFYY